MYGEVPESFDPGEVVVSARSETSLNERIFGALWSLKKATLFRFENLDVSPSRVTPGEEVVVSADLHNVGGGSSPENVELIVDGVLEKRRELELEPGKAASIKFGLEKHAAGYPFRGARRFEREFFGEACVVRERQFSTGVWILSSLQIL
ncbi:hypothetical protein AKJ62_03895 [candidate division MSBL1 archaeon SCGC-AAA259D14]|uniref:CARDB domain-containing protein n=1 Tax=candidate division MSBL1 archaeon SCGC-AAA259D14 TaxID=1698261 RepID=A0A133U4D1_9EURY|nr:hypothetical protein AKJ62_03895 [candidate division MSBL1 archaeon SCGC-AAA259D14]